MGHTSQPAPSLYPPTVHPHIRGAYSGGGHNPHPLAVHPHIRGAYQSWKLRILFGFGSSPHTWGIPAHPISRNQLLRFIPTYVGHTTIPMIRQRRTPVHPHIRGAYLDDMVACVSDYGSSPHTWGIRMRPVGSVPAPPVHPHIRGAYALAHRPDRGCPVHPHIRGAYGCQIRCKIAGLWFIPTYVGHTLIGSLGFPIVAVHPHIRGAYAMSWCSVVGGFGSSPHTWGIHWTAVRKMAGFSHFSYDFTRKSYFVQGLVFFGVIGAEAFPTHRRGRNQCLPGAHGGSVRNL